MTHGSLCHCLLCKTAFAKALYGPVSMPLFHVPFDYAAVETIPLAAAAATGHEHTDACQCNKCKGMRLHRAIEKIPEIPAGAEVVHGGCGKRGCQSRGWLLVTNRVEFGEQSLVESWEAWCPTHGSYGQSGSSDIWWERDVDMTDDEKAKYCGFKDAAEFRRVVGEVGR